MGYFSRAEFTTGLKALNAPSLDKLRKVCPKQCAAGQCCTALHGPNALPYDEDRLRSMWHLCVLHMIGVPCLVHLMQSAVQQEMFRLQCLVMRAGRAQSQSQNMHPAASPHSIALQDGCVGNKTGAQTGQASRQPPGQGTGMALNI